MRNLGGLFLVAAALLWLYALLPLGTALEFGGDEGYELMRGFLCSKGFVLYKEVWSDQPPLMALLLSLSFKACGPTILVARLLAAGFGLVLFTAFYWLVSQSRTAVSPAQSGRHRPSAGRRDASHTLHTNPVAADVSRRTLAHTKAAPTSVSTNDDGTRVWSAALATFFLLASPAILQLSVSVMKEVPAIGTALVSACLLFQWRKSHRWGWLLASGLVMGLALQIKVTAMVLIPALLTEILLAEPFAGPRLCEAQRAPKARRGDDLGCAASAAAAAGRRPAVPDRASVSRSAAQWTAAATSSFIAIALIWGSGGLRAGWTANFAAHPVAGMGRPEDFPVPASLFLDHAECWLAAIVGVVLIARQRRWREFAFPLVLLLTALALHVLHRPWWMYYYLHFAVPLAWLAGFAVAESIRATSRLLGASRFRASSSAAWRGVALCLLVGLALVRSEARLEGGVKDLRQRPRANADPVVAKMKECAARTHWVYAQQATYPFHAGLVVPPGLAVITLKRFWSGQITTREIVNTCRRYRAEQILLTPAQTAEDEWKEMLSPEYTVVYRDKNWILYLAKSTERE